MNINTINSKFIEEIKKKISGSVIESLAEILPMSKDAIYRRIRGEVLFTYSEAVLISQKLSISLDQININISNNFSFGIGLFFNDFEINDLEIYFDGIINKLTKVSENNTTILHVAGPDIPLFVTLNYKLLARLRLFKWLHENKRLGVMISSFSNTTIFDRLEDKLSVLLSLLRQIKSTYILSDAMFENYLKKVKHFVDIELIDQSEIDNIKSDLLALINEFETIVSSGTYSNGKEASIYLSDVSIDPTFGYLQNSNSEFAFVRMFGMNYGISYNHQILEAMQDTFENSKGYSTLISKSGSVKRIAFFNRQRAIINDFK